MTKPKEVIEDWLTQCRTCRRLTKWEADFIDSLSEQLDEKGGISDRQEEVLERIYADRT